MQRLILLRHAEAEQHAAGGDFHRALTARGRGDARAVGEALAVRGFAPDLVLVSSARRAVQTWEEARPALPAASVELDAGLYNAGSRALLAAAQAAEAQTAQAQTVLVVAHNPGLQILALELAAEAGAVGAAGLDLHRFAPATAAVFSFASGAPELLALIVPEGL